MVLSGNINYHQLSSAISIRVSSWMGTSNLMLYAFSIYRRVRIRSYYFIYITYITITIMRYAYIIYFTITITIITCIAITIIIIQYFHQNLGTFFRPNLVAFYAQFGGQKTKLNMLVETKKKSNGCKASIYFF